MHVKMGEVPTRPLLKRYGWIDPGAMVIPDEDDAGHDNASDLDSKLAMMLRGDVRRFSWVTSRGLRRQRIRRQAIISAISLSGMGECCSLSAELFDGSRSTIVFRSVVTSTSARFSTQEIVTCICTPAGRFLIDPPARCFSISVPSPIFKISSSLCSLRLFFCTPPET